jgi:sugar phosphate isomerase/epimerase
MQQTKYFQEGSTQEKFLCCYENINCISDDPGLCDKCDIDNLKPGDYIFLCNIPIGISTNILPKYSLPEAVACFDEYQFKHIELQTEYRARFDYTLPEVEVFLAACKSDIGIDFTVHAPYLKINLASVNEDLRKYSCLQVATLIPFCAELGVKCLTVHAAKQGASTLEKLLHSLELLVTQAQKYDISICLENTGSDRPGCLLLTNEECIDVCNQTGCMLTIDLVHLFSLNSDPFAVLTKLLPFAKNCHLADTQNHLHLHLPLGQGNLPIYDILALLCQHSYQGKLIIDEVEGEHTPGEYIKSAAAFRNNLTAFGY